ncbi:hypothetical protein OBBRIDRAFT_761044 [Obba rivulosa]|uniref:Uncharacterized protein n=1 Tax=Obba rivulosa TaxID=1052685 RepID=A0A8E2ALD1_9APHY|nr:hypothetical protein OBBRIDRAFT_761044 [Obba rivulosa]
MAPLAYASSQIVSLIIESALYGVYIMLLNNCIQVFFQKRKFQTLSTPLVIVAASLFLLITWHLVIDFIRLEVAFNSSNEVADIEVQYNDLRSIYSVMKQSVYVATTAISDAFILYRCYVVWNKNIWIVILPALLLVADVGTGITACCTLGLLKPGESFYVKTQAEISNAFFSTTLAVNGLCTGLIAGRVWWHQHSIKNLNVHRGVTFDVGRVATIMVESAAVYSATLIIVIAMYVTEITAAFDAFRDITSPIIGIVFALIVVRVGLGTSHETVASLSTFVLHAMNSPENTTTIQFSTNIRRSQHYTSTQQLQSTQLDGPNWDPQVENVAFIVTDAP